jgi:hypothetical protein
MGGKLCARGHCADASGGHRPATSDVFISFSYKRYISHCLPMIGLAQSAARHSDRESEATKVLRTTIKRSGGRP